MLKPNLQLALGQQLTMTPQLQQAIRLLQLSSRELELEIRNALEGNMMLEANGDSSWSDDAPEPAGDAAVVDADGAEAVFAVDDEPEYISAAEDQPDMAYGFMATEPEAPDEMPLRDHLLWQLEMAPFSPREQAIGVALIDAIDDHGYLADTPEAIGAALEPDLEVRDGEVTAMLRCVQQFDPAGVGARDLRECLQIQLRQLDPTTPGLMVAKCLISEHLEDVACGDWRELARRLAVDAVALDEAVALVRSLNPRPGGALAAPVADYIVPDVVVGHHHDRWTVHLNPVATPRLRVNNHYVGLLRSEPSLRGNEMLRNDLQEARWLVRSLEMRHQTLLKVAAALVEHQQAYLERGEEFMRPLILKQIADETGVHESTVSRITTNKYMQTPRGVVAFKYFFSSRLATDDGGQRSAIAIRALVKKLVAAEDAARPLSDGEITDRLQEQGIQVARRTVAKYREGLGIPARSARRRKPRPAAARPAAAWNAAEPQAQWG